MTDTNVANISEPVPAFPTEKLSMYDVARWKPITPTQYLETLGILHTSISKPKKHETLVQYLDHEPEGHEERWRLVTLAEVFKHDAKGEVIGTEMQPFLMVLYDVEGTNVKAVCFERTDTDLAED